MGPRGLSHSEAAPDDFLPIPLNVLWALRPAPAKTLVSPYTLLQIFWMAGTRNVAPRARKATLPLQQGPVAVATPG